MNRFKAELLIIGINPFVFVPVPILEKLFKASKRDKGKIPVCGSINGEPYTQTLLRYKGEWRLYINTSMLKDSPRRIGEIISLTIDFDPIERTVPFHPKLKLVLDQDKKAKSVFDSLTISMQREIIRYIANLKTEASIDSNIQKTIGFLKGKNRFLGRDIP